MPDLLALVEPAHFWVPPRTGSYGDEAIDLARLYGRELDPEQQLAVDAMLSYGPGGRWVAFETVRLEPRQNGKTGGEILPVVMFDLFMLPPDRITWTAHLFRTSRDAFMDVMRLVDGCDELSRRVKKVSYAHGEEGVWLTSGASLEFLARSKGGGRGIGGKRVVMDEALFLAAEAMGALIPTLAARSVFGDPQINYASSAAVLGSDHLRTLVKRGRAGGDPSLVYVEHCAPGTWADPGCELGPECPHVVGTEGCVLDDEQLWRMSNPAVGRRISLPYLRAERRALPVEEFGRERLGWHTEPAGAGGMPLEAWEACTDRQSMPKGRPVFMIDAAPKSKSAAIVAAMWRNDGLPHIEVVAHGPGVEWVPARAIELGIHEPLDWVIDPGGPAGALLAKLHAAGIEPREMSTRDMGQACEAFSSAVTEQALRHLGDPVLGRAIQGSGQRDIGDGLWAWSRRKSDADITTLVGATGAFWGLSVSPPPKPPPPQPVVLSTVAARSETSDLYSAGF